MKLRKLCWTIGLAGALCIPALAQYQERQDQPRHDQDDQNRDRDRGHDEDRNRGAYYNQDTSQWRNTKAYQQGWKDGEHDRSKNKGERANHRHWKSQQDEQAYQAGYYDAYRGTQPQYNRPDRDHDLDNDRDRH